MTNSKTRETAFKNAASGARFVKPHLYKLNGWWFCVGSYSDAGHGHSPKGAYRAHMRGWYNPKDDLL